MTSVMLTIAAIIFPGWLILFRKHFFPSLHVIEKIPLSFAASFSYWILGFWWLKYIPISLTVWIYTSLGISIGACIYIFFRHRYDIFRKQPISYKPLYIFLFIVILAIPQILLVLQQIAPAGQDMSMHGYIAAMIAQIDVFPKTISTIYPIHQFGLYPFGFSTIIAIMSRINGLPIYTNALLVTGLTHFLFDYALYLLLRSKFSIRISALITLLAAWTSANPHMFIEWGANPSVLSLAFVFLSIATILQHPIQKYILLATVFAVTSFCINYMFLIALIYVSIMTGCIYALRIRPPKSTIWNMIAKAICIGTLLLTPLLHTYIFSGFTITHPVKTYISKLHYDETHAWISGVSVNGLGEITSIIADSISPTLLLLYVFSLIITRRKKYAIAHGAFILVIYILIINARYWWLPFSSVLYPHRIILLFLMPIAWSIAEAIEYIQIRQRVWGISAVIILLYIFGAQQNMSVYLKGSIQNQLMTRNDLSVLSWLHNHSTPDDIVWNRYEDAGVWIPATIQRAITLYHTNPVDMVSTMPAPKRLPTFAFIGESSPQESMIHDLVYETTPLAKDWKFTILYSVGNAAVYRIEKR